VTSAATPRTMERVPAGAVFGPAELVFSLYEEADYGRFKVVVDALQLVEDDYLGGSGSRGSGKVRFSQLKVAARAAGEYSRLLEYSKTFGSLQELADDFAALRTWLAQNVPVE